VQVEQMAEMKTALSRLAKLEQDKLELEDVLQTRANEVARLNVVLTVRDADNEDLSSRLAVAQKSLASTQEQLETTKNELTAVRTRAAEQARQLTTSYELQLAAQTRALSSARAELKFHTDYTSKGGNGPDNSNAISELEQTSQEMLRKMLQATEQLDASERAWERERARLEFELDTLHQELASHKQVLAQKQQEALQDNKALQRQIAHLQEQIALLSQAPGAPSPGSPTFGAARSPSARDGFSLRSSSNARSPAARSSRSPLPHSPSLGLVGLSPRSSPKKFSQDPARPKFFAVSPTPSSSPAQLIHERESLLALAETLAANQQFDELVKTVKQLIDCVFRGESVWPADKKSLNAQERKLFALGYVTSFLSSLDV
jgi:hypothetical protein